jgi:hypothetical protein
MWRTCRECGNNIGNIWRGIWDKIKEHVWGWGHMGTIRLRQGTLSNAFVTKLKSEWRSKWEHHWILPLGSLWVNQILKPKNNQVPISQT